VVSERNVRRKRPGEEPAAPAAGANPDEVTGARNRA
jgi:hypothetical protein